MATATRTANRRRRLQFGIRSLLILTVVFALLFGWLTANKRYSRTRARIFNHIEDLGGTAAAYPEMPNWICQWLEDDFYKLFDSVQIDLSNAKDVDDAVLGLMAELRRVDYLDVSGTQIRGPGLAHLQGKKLKVLNVCRTPMTDEGMEYLKHLEDLEQVYLGGTRVTELGVAELGEALPNTEIHFR
jgi:hypothetical protein